MSNEPQYAPGPYQTQDVGGLTSFHAYVVDANNRKIGVAWGPVAEKVWTQALFAASHEMLAALRPFVFGDPALETILFGAMDDNAAVTFTIKLGDCRRARAVLEKIEGRPFSSGERE